jgi:hypothetical protein
MVALSRFFGIDDGWPASGQIPTLSINSAEYRRNRRKQKLNKLSHLETAGLGGGVIRVNSGTW